MPISNPTQVDWSKPGAIGSTTRNTIKATTIDASGVAHTFGASANGSTAIAVNAAVGVNRQLIWQTAGLNRWNLYANTTPESVGDAGSLIAFSYYTDAGTYKGDIFSANRLGAFTVSAATTRFTSANLGFYSATPIAKPTVTGSKSSGAALTSLISALANLGLITDSTTA